VRDFLFSLSTLSGCESKGRRQGRKRKWQGKEPLPVPLPGIGKGDILKESFSAKEMSPEPSY
jgi:hypothetical protein